MKSLAFSGAQLTNSDTHSELSAQWNGIRVYFKFSGRTIPAKRGEAFVASFLPLAMYLGQDLRLPEDLPLSREFVDNLPTVQEIWKRWCGNLKEVSVHAPIEEPVVNDPGVICNFSGGVDGSYTFLRHKDEITHLLLASCFDDDGEDDVAWANSVRARRKLAEHYGKSLVKLHTNVRRVLEQNGVSWQLAFGPVIGGVGSIFGDHINYVSSGYPYDDLHPDGVHPLLDPLWSTSATSVVHVGGGQSRTEKTVFLTRDQFSLDNLQVCWKHSDQNCGQCPKCVRTGLALHLVGKRSASIPYEFKGEESLRALKPYELGSVTFLEDLVDLAWEVGNQDVARPLLKMRKRFMVRNAFDELLKATLPTVLARKLRARQDWVQQMYDVSFTSTSRFL